MFDKSSKKDWDKTAKPEQNLASNDDWQMWQDLMHAQTPSDLRDFQDTDYRFERKRMR
jgi:hypothetical protein